jgi:hypothetical protein
MPAVTMNEDTDMIRVIQRNYTAVERMDSVKFCFSKYLSINYFEDYHLKNLSNIPTEWNGK